MKTLSQGISCRTGISIARAIREFYRDLLSPSLFSQLITRYPLA